MTQLNEERIREIAREEAQDIREIAREEAQDIHDVTVDDGDEEWSLSKLMGRFEISRRTALKAIGLIGLGYTAPKAVVSAVSQPAEAAPEDDLTVPGTLDAGAVSTDAGTLDGDVMMGFPDSSSQTSVSLGSGWAVESSDRPTLVFARLVAESDGTTDGILNLRVDESGGTSQDYQVNAFASASGGSGFVASETVKLPLPPGAAIKFENTSDPNGGNTVGMRRKITL
jgi:hypothetical protein